MIPASRAVCTGSPFLSAPARTSRRAPADMRTRPRATTSRAVTGLPPTSTMRAWPSGPTWVSSRDFGDIHTSREEERQALERHREVDVLQLDALRDAQRAGGEVEDRLDARADDRVDDLLRGVGGHGEHRDVEAFALGEALELARVPDRHAAARVLPDLVARGVEQGDDVEAVVPEARVVREREAQVAGAEDHHLQLPVEAQDLAEVAPQILDVVAHAADPELAEMREILPDLRRVEAELLGEPARRHRVHARRFER